MELKQPVPFRALFVGFQQNITWASRHHPVATRVLIVARYVLSYENKGINDMDGGGVVEHFSVALCCCI